MTNPTLIITGASRGIGRSIALLAIQNLNANVIGVARSQAALQKLSSHIETELKLKDRFKFVVGDVTAESTAVEVVDVASKSWSGRLDGLVLNAGYFMLLRCFLLLLCSWDERAHLDRVKNRG